MRELSFIEAIREAQEMILERIPNAFIIGEGVPDPKAVFGSCTGLAEKYKDRVYDSPVSESGVTGICIGAAIAGLHPIHVHQRMDFSLYAMDQIINNLAKWKSMFGLDRNLPMIIRMTVGRGWGAGNQHSQNLEALFAHIPGLRVVVPHDPYTAKGCLIDAVMRKEPTIFIEHKWLHNMKGHVTEEWYATDGVKHESYGKKSAIISWGATSLAAREAARVCESKLFLLTELDTTQLYSIVNELLLNQITNIVVAQDAWQTGGFVSEVIAYLAEVLRPLKLGRVTLSNKYPPSSHHLAADYYITANKIAYEIGALTNTYYPIPAGKIIPHDVDPFLHKVVSAI